MAIPHKCPLCKASSHYQNVETTHVYGSSIDVSRAFFHCQYCDVRYQYPRLTKIEEKKFYKAEFENFMSSRSGSSGGWQKAEDHIYANKSTVTRRLKYLKEYIKKPSSILEIGCSSGFMLYPFIKKNYSCEGVEPSGIFSNYVKSKGINIYSSVSDLRNKNPNKKYDFIFHFFVLEHISNPYEFLSDQITLLKKGGKIIFEIPNVADPLYSLYKISAFEKFYWSIAHPWYFSEKSLSFFLDQVGLKYKIIRDQRYDFSNHMIWARDGKPGGTGYFSNKISKSFEKYYKKMLISSGRCDTLIGIISK